MKNFKVNPKYMHFAIRKATGKIVNGWEQSEDIKYWSKLDLKDMFPDNKVSDFKICGRFAGWNNWDNWEKTVSNELCPHIFTSGDYQITIYAYSYESAEMEWNELQARNYYQTGRRWYADTHNVDHS